MQSFRSGGIPLVLFILFLAFSGTAFANNELWQAAIDGNWELVELLLAESEDLERDLSYKPNPSDVNEKDVATLISESRRVNLLQPAQTNGGKSIPAGPVGSGFQSESENDESQSEEDQAQGPYVGKRLSELNALIQERGLKKAKNLAVAVSRLESHDRGELLGLPQAKDPATFQSQIKDLSKPTLFYRDNIFPARGIPTGVYHGHVFVLLDDKDLGCLAKTCRYFYQVVTSARIKRLHATIKANYPLEAVANDPKLEAVVFQGKGLTPGAVSFFAREHRCLGKGKYNTTRVVRDIVQGVAKFGDMETFIAQKLAKKSQFNFEKEAVQARLDVLNDLCADLGYHNRCFWIKSSRQLVLKIDLKTDQGLRTQRMWQDSTLSRAAKLPECKNVIKPIEQYLKQGTEFDWGQLETYLNTLHENGFLQKKKVIVQVKRPRAEEPEVLQGPQVAEVDAPVNKAQKQTIEGWDDLFPGLEVIPADCAECLFFGGCEIHGNLPKFDFSE